MSFARGWSLMPVRRWVAAALLVLVLFVGAVLAWFAWITEPRDYSGLLALLVLAVPLVLLVFYLRRPYDSRSVPRDAMAVRGKAKLPRTLGVVPNKAFDDKIRDEAADQPESDTPD